MPSLIIKCMAERALTSDLGHARTPLIIPLCMVRPSVRARAPEGMTAKDFIPI
jgi:hypothetical protein